MDNTSSIDKETYAMEWLNIAEMDLSCAKHLLTHYPLPIEIICYHCQQSAEKALKGLLVLNRQTPPRVHDLMVLLPLIEIYVSGIADFVPQCNVLNKYAVAPRYPAELDISEPQVRTAIQYAETLLSFCKPFFTTNDTSHP
ncbi:HEPN domain-containing protein [Planctomycetales bacterium]|nr:HEPN domain-containing protein [Planctomycetales bacterium]